MREARYDAAELDEVVADYVQNFHLERMDNGSWWIGLDQDDGTTTHISLCARAPGKTIVSGRCEFDV